MKNSDTIHKNSVAVILINNGKKLLVQHRDNIDNIEFPDYWGLIGGWIESNETPEDAALREIQEELYFPDNRMIKLESLQFLIKCKRTDRPWFEYVLIGNLNCDTDSMLVREGQAFGEFDINECLFLLKMAPHHKQHLKHFIENIQQIDKFENIKFKINNKNLKIMTKVKDYIELTKLSNVKDYKALEVGDGYIIPSEHRPVGVIHTKECAEIIALLVFAKETPRGDHYHHDKIEYMTVLSGKLKCEFSLPEEPNDKFEIILEEGHQIRIKPGCIHTYTAIEKDVYALEYAPNRYREKDVVMANS